MVKNNNSRESFVEERKKISHHSENLAHVCFHKKALRNSIDLLNSQLQVRESLFSCGDVVAL